MQTQLQNCKWAKCESAYRVVLCVKPCIRRRHDGEVEFAAENFSPSSTSIGRRTNIFAVNAAKMHMKKLEYLLIHIV